jgi:GTPase SAR1 family protein
MTREIEASSLVVLVYDVTKESSEERVIDFWLPFIASVSNIPVLLVGNKIDLNKKARNLAQIIQDTTENFNCHVGVECTAKSFQSVSRIFEIAQELVLYPITPLYDPRTKNLTEEFRRALALIFRLVDKDRNLHLSDYEIQEFNVIST